MPLRMLRTGLYAHDGNPVMSLMADDLWLTNG